MMRAHLDDAVERGDAIAALWASEATIYGRFGYGLASLTGEIELPRDRSTFMLLAKPAGAIRFVSVEEASSLFPRVYDHVRLETPGMCSRSPAWWENRVLLDLEARRGGGGPARLVVLERAGEPAAYAIYRHHQSFEYSSATGHVYVVEALGVDAPAVAGIWRYLFDIDWIAAVKAQLLPVDHPLVLLLGELRRMRFTIADGLWVRLLDVGKALSGRGYMGDGEAVLEVTDEFLPANNGRWRVAAGEASRTDTDADIELDAPALGSVYLGGFSFAELARAGRVRELREGALARADALFRADRLPWCPEIF
jgi:predicted acetyltransferase